jgi:hypothetical protein
VLPVRLVHGGSQEQRVRREKKEIKVLQALLVPQDLTVQLAPQDHKGRPALRDHQALLAPQGHKGVPGLPELQVHKDRPELPERLVHREQQDLQAHKDRPELLV